MPDDTQADHEPVTIGLVAHHASCPRRGWLEAVRERTDTAQMAVGSAAHQLTDDPKSARSGQSRAVDVVNEQWGHRGRCDPLRRSSDTSVDVVE